ncbi:MAG: 1-acyl-sn-glycerol-3-phosphate acyltransferase [Desulfomonile sp.]|nr:1-acyl-sn-glycerol-3-phosphate acyltransferase [Desulfomonile sp.]
MKDSPEASGVRPDLLDGRYGHIPEVLDQRPAWILRKLIGVLSANVRIEPSVVEQLRDLARRGPIIYAMKYRGIYDLHFLRLRFKELGLPAPAFAFGLPPRSSWSVKKAYRVWKERVSTVAVKRSGGLTKEVIKDLLEKGCAGTLFLVDEQTLRDRYVHPDQDPLEVLLDVQGRMAAPLAIVPIFILYDRTARRTIRPFWETFLGDPDTPGIVRRVVAAVRRWTVPELLVGEPVHLVAEFEEFGADKSWEELPFAIREKLLDHINAAIRVNRGPEKLSRTEIKERVLRDERVKKAVGENGMRDGVSPEKVRKRAESYIQEIASDQRLQAHHFFYYVLNWMFSHVFDGIDVKPEQFAALKRVGRKGAMVFVQCHKSHFDYLVSGFMLFINQMAVPLFAAGKNLSFWPVGPLLRYAGAFFMRRTFQGNKLYTEVFAAYVKAIVEEQYNIIFYIEGGRSRTGKLLQPRLGLLTFLLRPVESGSLKDLCFVPTFIGYDLIPEESSYLRELTGAEKKKESFLAMIRSRDVLKTRYGKVFLRFHEPLRFGEFCRARFHGADPETLTESETRQLHHDFAYRLMAGIVKAAVVTGIELAAGALTCLGLRKVSHPQLMNSAKCLSDALRARGAEFADSLSDIAGGLQAALRMFGRRGFIEIQEPAELSNEPVYVIQDQRLPNLYFYRNALVNHLWPASVLAMVLCREDLFAAEITPAIREEFSALKEIFLKEIIVDPVESDDEILSETFELFRSKGWIQPPVGPPGENDEPGPLKCLRGILVDLALSYELVLAIADEAKESSSAKEIARRASKAAAELRENDGGPMIKAVSQITVRTALTRFHEMGILTPESSRKVSSPSRNSVRIELWKNRLAAASGRKRHLP